MKDLLQFGKALSDPMRIRILKALLMAELCVCEVADAFEVSQSTLSTHLQILRTAGLLEIEKRRTWIIYRIAGEYRERIEQIFQDFPFVDARIDRDRERLESRIRLRIDGCCVIGFGALEKQEEKANVN